MKKYISVVHYINIQSHAYIHKCQTLTLEVTISHSDLFLLDMKK